MTSIVAYVDLILHGTPSSTTHLDMISIGLQLRIMQWK
jgi:hypothetical protein